MHPHPTAGSVVRSAVAEIAAGRPVVVTDASGTGRLVLGAAQVTPESVAFLVRHGTGFLRVTVDSDRCRRLSLPPAASDCFDDRGPRVAVDLLGGGTGISARDRAATIARLAHPDAAAADFSRPGHVVPVLVAPDDLIDDPGAPEAAAALLCLAGQPPVAVLSEVESRSYPGELAGEQELARFAVDHELVSVTVTELLMERRRLIPAVARAAEAVLPTDRGLLRTIAYVERASGVEHLVLFAPHTNLPTATVSVHVECLAGNLLRSTACRCAEHLGAATTRAGSTGGEVVVYLRSSTAFSGCVRDLGTAGKFSQVVDTILADLGIDGDAPAHLDVKRSTALAAAS